MKKSWLIALIAGLLVCQPEERVSFNDDVRPILNAKCIGCHGGVKQAGGFGLVFRENALRETASGKYAIVPGKPQRSEIIARVHHTNPELRMPLDGEPLSAAEIRTLERWIEQGAEWEEHWAYQPPVKPEVPDLLGEKWVTNEIDAFVLAELRARGMDEAGTTLEPRDLLRRVSFDLTGLPPRPALAERFLAGTLSYPALVDSLLADPAYGEHQAAGWLDLARYADSRGYERDRPRTIWRYRDWVIAALNADMPYDQFALEQLAGDMLPEPTEAQLVATGFHRNAMSNEEGGSENEEYRVAAVIDRVNTTWEVFQGTTMSCVQCHAHPYDPLTHEDFYTSYALFDNTVDHDHISEAPVLRTLYAKDERKFRKLTEWIEEHDQEQAGAQVQRWRRMIKAGEPRIRPYHYDSITNGAFTGRADEDFLYLLDGGSFYLPARDLTDVAALHLRLKRYAASTLEVRRDGPAGPLLATLTTTKKTTGRGSKDLRLPLQSTTGTGRLYFTVSGEGKGDLLVFDAIGYEPRLPGQTRKGYAEIEGYINNLITAKDSLSTLIMLETEAESRRTTHLFERGNWLAPGKEVSGGVPALLSAIPAPEVPNRLAFARWLFSPQQPLTARVAVNRTWASVFGRGIVPTLEDMGSQGERPSHPELLDYLATEFSGPLEWRRKKLLRMIVLSTTYRRASAPTNAQLAADPRNALLTRGPRKRLSAEQVRDQALAISGLLSRKQGGPSVMPPQPDGLWDNIAYNRLKWVTSKGEDRYRRALYTYLRRSNVHPLMTTFDATNRELCLSRRTVTNTPLQALMTLNDPALLEVAEVLAEGVAAEGDFESKVGALYQQLLYRDPAAEEVGLLRELYADALTAPALASAYAPTEGRPLSAEQSAMTVVANTMLNLDEFLTLR